MPSVIDLPTEATWIARRLQNIASSNPVCLVTAVGMLLDHLVESGAPVQDAKNAIRAVAGELLPFEAVERGLSSSGAPA